LTSGHSDAQGWASECPDVNNYKWQPGLAQDAL